MIELFLRKGTDVDMRDSFGNTPLIDSIDGLQSEIENTQFLVSAGADVNAASDAGLTALALAVETTNVEAVEFLLDHGAKVRPRGTNDASILVQAEKKGNQEIIALLKAADRGWTILKVD